MFYFKKKFYKIQQSNAALFLYYIMENVYSFVGLLERLRFTHLCDVLILWLLQVKHLTNFMNTKSTSSANISDKKNNDNNKF